MANDAGFQVYRIVGADRTVGVDRTDEVWWRVVSPNGRVMARSPHEFDDAATALEHIGQVRARRLNLQVSIRVMPSHRWRWQLLLETTVMAVSWADLDRRIRCEAAWRSFVTLAGTAAVDTRVHTFRRGRVSAS